MRGPRGPVAGVLVLVLVPAPALALVPAPAPAPALVSVPVPALVPKKIAENRAYVETLVPDGGPDFPYRPEFPR